MVSTKKAAVKQLSISEMFSSPTIVVKIGVEEKPYHISKALAMHHSGYFLGAFNSDNFVEGATGETSLQEVEPCIFEPFLEWLYTQRLPKTNAWRKKYNIPEDCSIGRHLASLYLFADRFLVPVLKKLVFKITVDFTNEQIVTDLPSYDTMASVFDSLAEDDAYLQLLVDIYCHRWTAEVHKEKLSRNQDTDQLPTSFFLQVMGTYAKMNAGKDKKKLFVAADYLEGDV